MKVALLLVMASTSLAQTEPDAAALLRDLADSIRSSDAWRIEGSVEYFDSRGTASFVLLQRSPTESRFEQTGGPIPATVVCDGLNTWVYSPPLNSYAKAALTDNSICSPIIQNWRRLPSTLDSAVLAGHGTFTSQGQSLNCQLVRGSSVAELASAGRLVRTLCIDPTRKSIAWEEVESRWSRRRYTYSKVEQNVNLPPEAFVFEPPPGSQLTKFKLPLPRPLGSPELPQDVDVSGPRLSSKKQPKYDDASRKAKVEGTVELYVVVDDNGVPSEVSVFRTLNPALDANAIKAVRQWRFVPATKSGQPIATALLIEVNYRVQP
jgi:TonB family protein